MFFFYFHKDFAEVSCLFCDKMCSTLHSYDIVIVWHSICKPLDEVHSKYVKIFNGVLLYTTDRDHPVYHLRRDFKLVLAVGKMKDTKIKQIFSYRIDLRVFALAIYW